MRNSWKSQELFYLFEAMCKGLPQAPLFIIINCKNRIPWPHLAGSVAMLITI